MNRIFIDDCENWLNSNYAIPNSYDIIYLDPPYNTTSKLSYNDSRTDWSNFMSNKMSKAHEMLKDDGVIFISIDDNCLIELCVLCDKIFNKKNRIGIIITHQAQRSNAKHINTIHEYVVAYAKNTKLLPKMSILRTETENKKFINELINNVKKDYNEKGLKKAEKTLKDAIKKHINNYPNDTWLNNYRCVSDEGEIFFPKDLSVPGEPNTVNIDEINLHLKPLPTRKWSTPQKFISLHKNNRLHYLNNRPYEKHYLYESTDNISSIVPFYSRQGTEELKRLGLEGLFDTPKPVELIKMLLLSLAEQHKTIKVLDFFAGSGTTAQAIYEINTQQTKCTYNYDLIQINENIREKTKQHTKALQLGIIPTIPNAMIYRINTFLTKNNIKKDYKIINDTQTNKLK